MKKINVTAKAVAVTFTSNYFLSKLVKLVKSMKIYKMS